MSSKVQLSGNEMLNKKVLSSRRKVMNDEAVHRDTGRVFHARAAATGNAWSPRLDRLVADVVLTKWKSMCVTVSSSVLTFLFCCSAFGT